MKPHQEQARTACRPSHFLSLSLELELELACASAREFRCYLMGYGMYT